jgi:hypothetical protein
MMMPVIRRLTSGPEEKRALAARIVSIHPTAVSP